MKEFKLYRPYAVATARVICICHTIKDCDKLRKFGWCATTILDQDNNECIDWMRHCDPELFVGLKQKRLVVFAHRGFTGRYAAFCVMLKLMDHVIDMRVVNVPIGDTITQFLHSIEGAKAASQALGKLINEAIPLTSRGSFIAYEALFDFRKAIVDDARLDSLTEHIDVLEAELRDMQKRAMTVRAKQVMKT